MKKTKERGSVRSTLQQMKKSYMLYIFLLPSVILIAIFCYAPMYGVLMAFQNFSPSKGIMGSPWVGFKWFETFFNMPRFWQILGNTLTLSVYSLLVGFPIPIILAILINSVENDRFKRVTQTVTYMPHFISTVVLVGMITVFLSPRSGFLNHFFELLGAAEDTYYMGIAEYFPHIYVWSGVWQDTPSSPSWSSRESDAQPVFRYYKMTGANHVVYDPGIGRYLMGNYSFIDRELHPRPIHQMGYPESSISQLTLFEAPEPWGPWKLFYRNDDWGTYGDYQPNFPTKWMTADGRLLYMVSSGSWDDYNFVVQKLALRLKGETDFPPEARLFRYRRT